MAKNAHLNLIFREATPQASINVRVFNKLLAYGESKMDLWQRFYFGALRLRWATQLAPFIEVLDSGGKHTMKKFTLTFCLAFGLVNVCYADDARSECKAYDEAGIQKGILIESYESGRKVIGEGRAYFFSGPDAACKEKNVFIIPGDEVIAYREYGGYTAVMFINVKRVGDAGTEGWVLTSRLEGSGKGVASGL